MKTQLSTYRPKMLHHSETDQAKTTKGWSVRNKFVKQTMLFASCCFFSLSAMFVFVDSAQAATTARAGSIQNPGSTQNTVRQTSYDDGLDEVPPSVMSNRDMNYMQRNSGANANSQQITPDEQGNFIEQGDSMLQPDHENWGMPAPTWSSGSWFSSGDTYIEADFFFAHRSRDRKGVRNRRLFAFQLFGDRLRKDDTPWGIEPGMRITYGRYLDRDYRNRDHSLEFTFYGINEFEATDTLTTRDVGAHDIINVPRFLGFTEADTMQFNTKSQLMSYEINYKVSRRLERDRMVMGPDGCWTRQYSHGHLPSFFFGLRYVEFHEEFAWTSRQLNANGTVVSPNLFSGDMDIRTNNDLIGVQIGGECIDQYETWYWGIRGKGGAYANLGDAQISFSGIDTTPTVPPAPLAVPPGGNFSGRASIGAAAFVGELSLLAGYNISPNWTLRAGYDFVWVGGIAKAQDQVTFEQSNPPQLRTNGLLFLQAVTIGTEFVW